MVENTLIQKIAFLTDLSATIVQGKKDGVKELSIERVNEWPEMLADNPGNVLAVVDTFANHATQWTIRGADHELSLVDGLRHSVSYQCQTADGTPWFVLDHAAFGQLSNNRKLAL